MAYKDHRHGFYNDSFEMTKCALVKESLWDEDNLTQRLKIKKEDIIESGVSLTGIYSHALGNEKNQTGHYGQYRIFADLDNNQNLQIKIAQYANISDPTSEPLLVYDTITAGTMADITEIYITVTMHANSMTDARFVIGFKNGNYYLTPCVNAGAKGVLGSQWLWINAVKIENIPDTGLNSDKGTIRLIKPDFRKPSYAHAVNNSYQFQIKNAYWPLSFKYADTYIDVSHVNGFGDLPDPAPEYNGVSAQMSCLADQNYFYFLDTEKFKIAMESNMAYFESTWVTAINLLKTATKLQNFTVDQNPMYPANWGGEYAPSHETIITDIDNADINANALDNLENSIALADRRVTLTNGNYIKFVGAESGRTKMVFCLKDDTELFSDTYLFGANAVNGAFANKITFLGIDRYTNPNNNNDPTYEMYKELTGFEPYRLNLVKNFIMYQCDPMDGNQHILTPIKWSESVVFNRFEYYDINPILVNLWLEDVEGDPGSPDDESENTPEEGKEMEDETIDDASLPQTSALDIGVIAVFNPSTSQMQALTQEMQDTNFLDEIAKYYKNSPLEGIMSCHVVPINVETLGTDAPHFGNWTFQTSLPKVSKQFYTVNFGSIKLEKKFASFLDYAPYTSIQVYLPYIGYRELDVDDVMGKTIGVKYNFDIITGAILAEVTVDGSVHYQYSGSAIMQFPLTASNHNNLISSIVGLVTSGAATIAGLAVGGPAGGIGTAMAVGGVMSLASSGVHAVASSKPEIQHGGSFGMTNGFLSVKTPYLIANRPNVTVPEDFAKYAGRMTNKTKYVYEISGYTEYMAIDVDSITALDEEKAEIESILKGGFYA